MCCLVITSILGIISQHSWCFCMWYLHALTLFWKYWSVLERCMVLLSAGAGELEMLEVCLYAEIRTWRERESEMNHAEAVQNERIWVGASAYEAAGKRSGSDLVLVLRWCSPIVLLQIYSHLREERISLKADECRAGDHSSRLKQGSCSVAETRLCVVQLPAELWSCSRVCRCLKIADLLLLRSGLLVAFRKVNGW